MAQNYPPILSSESLQNSRQKFLDRDDAIRSSHSGTVFPTLDLVAGMFCLRTDLNHLYVLETLDPLSWQLVLDLNKTALNQEGADARYINVAGDKMQANLTMVQGGYFGCEDTSNLLRWRFGYDGTAYRLDRFIAGTGAYGSTPISINDAGEVYLEGARVQARLGYTPLSNAGGTISGSLTVSGPFASSSSATAQVLVQTPSGTGSSDAQVASVGLVIPGIYGTKLNLRGDGIMGFGGWSAAPWRWYVNTTNGDMIAAGNVVAYSDKRLKKQVARIRGALSKVIRMRGVSYIRKDTKQAQIGVIAQEVEKIVPELVVDTVKHGRQKRGYKSVAYGNFAGLFIEAIKELAAELRDLRARMDEIERRV